jgi:hypothetical protein
VCGQGGGNALGVPSSKRTRINGQILARLGRLPG